MCFKKGINFFELHWVRKGSNKMFSMFFCKFNACNNVPHLFENQSRYIVLVGDKTVQK